MAAKKILILGSPGTGKSSSTRNVDPNTTFIISPDGKGLPIKNWNKNYKTVTKENGKLDLEKSNYYATADPAVIVSLLKAISSNRPDIKLVVIDTITLMMTKQYMSKATEKGFDKYTIMALDAFNVLTAPDSLREDLTVVYTGHVQEEYDATQTKQTSFKVIGGKLIGEKIQVEGLFDIVLYSDITRVGGKAEYTFMTQNNGTNTGKSPLGMFEEDRIPNDLQLVLQKITEYYQE